MVHHTKVDTWQVPEVGFDMILADFWTVDEFSEVVRSLVLGFWTWNGDSTSRKSGLSIVSCPDSCTWSDEKTSSKSMAVFSNECDSSLNDERSATSSSVVSKLFRYHVRLLVPIHLFWRVEKTLWSRELEEETENVETDGLFDLCLDHETAFSLVFQALSGREFNSFKAEGLKLLFVK